MQVLIIIDAQNEFSENGKRPVPHHLDVIEVIRQRVKKARIDGTPIAWIRHFNQPHESPAFIPGTWGVEFVDGFGPDPAFNNEVEFQKNVYGAFTGTNVGSWLKATGADEVLLMGFYTHGCLSTTAREAIMAGFKVFIDAHGTEACDMDHEILGNQTADEVRRSALLHLANMGANIIV
ncbi:cysteine hydrolase family protein [Mucilaginibacter sp. X5P1]|uniref:cysteine hydrolase family protein n=1 Tax=Mucilaginibacter sp. X5P1 TaxID=2723088 RepID=UPI00160CFF8F|nr:isochorismatase family cysteine hydrolase [Mucilaginibacter sp. X5P1]MBB6139832.1 nicotinamidase-related amidase [Mucilaginibacter sp. X5P1]